MTNAIVTHESGFFGRTPQPGQFQQIIANVVRPARVRAERGGRYDFRMNHVRFTGLEVTVLSYGDALEVDLPADSGESLVLQLVLTGLAHTYVDGGEPVGQSRASAHLAPSSLPLRIRCQRNCRHFLVRMDRGVLEQAADGFRQRLSLPDPRAELSLATPGGRALRRYLSYVTGEIGVDRCRDLTRHVARATEQSLLAHVLAALETPESTRGGAHVSRGGVAEALAGARRAADFIDAHLQDDIGLREIVSICGTSPRSLYRAFERLHGTSPIAYLRERRLEKAHAELVAADPRSVRVTDVALRWGFAHLSEFALRYRARYGCLPSQTLRRA